MVLVYVFVERYKLLFFDKLITLSSGVICILLRWGLTPVVYLTPLPPSLCDPGLNRAAFSSLLGTSTSNRPALQFSRLVVKTAARKQSGERNAVLGTALHHKYNFTDINHWVEFGGEKMAE